MPTELFKMYPKHSEYQYLETIKEVIENGNVKGDRTGTGIIGKFGY